MFTYLSTTLPGFTVNDLAFYLGKIEKGNLVSMLEQSCVKGKSLISIVLLAYLLRTCWLVFY